MTKKFLNRYKNFEKGKKKKKTKKEKGEKEEGEKKRKEWEKRRIMNKKKEKNICIENLYECKDLIG